MAGEPEGRTLAILATDGVEEVELTKSAAGLRETGARAHVAAPKEGGTIEG